MDQQRSSSLAPIPASKLQSAPEHPGERLANYFDNFFKTVLAVAIVGANITFSKIVQTVVPPNHVFGKTQTLYFIGYSFFFFVLTVAFTSLFTSLLSLYKPQAVQFFGTRVTRQRRTVMWYATFVSLLIYGLIIVAFIFISLVVVAYVGSAGWASLAFVIIFGVIGFTAIMSQSPLFMGPDGKQEFDHGPRFTQPRRPLRRQSRQGEIIYYDEKSGMVVDESYDIEDGFQDRRSSGRGRQPQFDEEQQMPNRGRSGRRTEVLGGYQAPPSNQQLHPNPAAPQYDGRGDTRQNQQPQRANPPAKYDEELSDEEDYSYKLPATRPNPLTTTRTTYDEKTEEDSQRLSKQLPAYDPAWKYSRDGNLRVREFEQRTRRGQVPPIGVLY